LAAAAERALGAGGRGLPFPEVAPAPLPVRTSRSARAPKLRRRPKGVGGTLELPLGPSLSSNGLSSTEPEFALERLSVRGRAGEKGELWFGEPESPIVVRERRRRWACAAASVMEPAMEPLVMALEAEGAEVDEVRPKRSTNWPAKEERRRALPMGGDGGEGRSCADIVSWHCEV